MPNGDSPSVFPSDPDRPEGDVTAPTNAVPPDSVPLDPEDVKNQELADRTPETPADATGAEAPVIPETDGPAD